VGPCRDLDGNVLKTSVDGGDGRSLLLVDGLEILLAANLRLEDPGAIDRRDERVPVLHATHVARGRETADVQLVLAVGREQMLDLQSTPGAQRQTIDMDALIGASRRTVGGAAGSG